MVIKYIIASVVSGFAFGLLDGIINANPLAVKLLEAYKPIAKGQANFVFGLAADLVYGFALAGLFLVLYTALPGSSGILKGLSFGVIVWFLRVVMFAASAFVMYEIPGITLLYQLGTGLVEMLALGTIYGLFLTQG
jgi:hypothetical protein